MSSIVTDIAALRKKSDPVTSVDEAKDLIEKIKIVLAGISNGMGVAAIQIGIAKKVAVIRVGPDQFLNLINPEFEEGIDEIIYLREGCLSMPGYFQDTKRYRQITIKNQVIDGDKFREERQVFYYPQTADDNLSRHDPLTCIAVQHELDHFEGRLITDNVVKREPLIRMPKVGRNDPCPCGSNKKFKKCCGK